MQEVDPMTKLMKKTLILAAALMMLTGTLSAAHAQGNLLEKIKAAGKIVVATSPDYAPYEFLDLQGNPVGADISLINYTAQQLGVEVQLEPLDFDACLAAVAMGKVDLTVSGMVPKPERAESMDFSDVYYNDGNQVIVILKEKADTLKTLADFAGKLVAAQNGTLQQDLVSQQLPDAKMEPIAKIPDAIMMLKTGKVDGVALASVVADNYVATHDDLVICQTPFEYNSLGVVMAAPKNSPELIEALNLIIKDVQEQGLYLKWMEEAIELSNAMNK